MKLKLLTLLTLVLLAGLPAFSQAIGAVPLPPVPAEATASLPQHIFFVAANYNPNNHPNGSAQFGPGMKVSSTDYLVDITEVSPSTKGILTTNRAGLEHIVYAAGNFYGFLSADGGIAMVNQSVSGSWSGGGGVAQKVTAIKSHNVWAFVHVRVVDSAVATDRRAVVGSLGFVFGGN